MSRVPGPWIGRDRTELDVIDSWTKEAARNLEMLCVL